MFFRDLVVESAGKIDRNIDPDFMTGIHLSTKQIEIEMRVYFPDFGRMIAPSVMTAGKTGDGIDCRLQQGFLPFLPVEGFADIRDLRRCMKIQMDLTKFRVGSFFVRKFCFRVDVLYFRIPFSNGCSASAVTPDTLPHTAP